MSPWLALGLGIAMTTLTMGLVRAVLRAWHGPIATGPEALVGMIGIATSDLLPEGVVEVGHEAWRAAAEGGPIHRGEPVRVIAVEGVTLRVARQPRARLDHPYRGGPS